MTVECYCWIPATLTVPSGNAQVYSLPIIGQTTSGSNGEQYLGLYPSANGIGISVDLRHGTPGYSWATPDVASRETWVHLAFVMDTSSIRVFIDGIKKMDITTSRKWTNNAYPFYIGGNYNAAYPQYKSYWNGYLKDLRITVNIARYVDDFIPPTAPLPY